MRTRVDAIVAERARMLTGLRAQGWDVPDSQANFVWLALGEHAKSFADRSARAGVLVRPFAGDGVRISVGETEATDLLLEVTAEPRAALSASRWPGAARRGTLWGADKPAREGLSAPRPGNLRLRSLR